MDNEARTYAYALKTLERDSQKSTREIAHAFVSYMQAHGRRWWVPQVLRVYARLKKLEEKADAMSVRVARESDRDKLSAYIKSAATQMGASTQKECVSVDLSLIGGFIIEKDGKRLDASYKHKLVQLYKKLIETPHHG